MDTKEVRLTNEAGDVKTVQARFVKDCEALGWKREKLTADSADGDSGDVDKDFDRDTAIALLKEAGKNVHPNTGDAKLKAMLEEISA